MLILQLFGSVQFFNEIPIPPVPPKGPGDQQQQQALNWGPEDYYHAMSMGSGGLNLVHASSTIPRVANAFNLANTVNAAQITRLAALAENATYVAQAQRILAMTDTAAQATTLARAGLTLQEAQLVANGTRVASNLDYAAKIGQLTAYEIRMLERSRQIGSFGRFVLGCGTRLSGALQWASEIKYLGVLFRSNALYRSIGWLTKLPIRLCSGLGRAASWIPGVARLGALGGGRAIPILGGVLAIGDCALSWATALNETDPEKRQSLMIQAGINTGCTAAGAVIGGIIGSIIPGAGTFLGAMIGASIGNLVGNLVNFIGFSDNPIAQGIRSVGSAIGNVVAAPFRAVGGLISRGWNWLRGG